MTYDESLLRLRKVARRHEGMSGELHDIAEAIGSGITAITPAETEKVREDKP